MYSIKNPNFSLKSVITQLMELHLDIAEADQVLGSNSVSTAFLTNDYNDIVTAMMQLQYLCLHANSEAGHYARMKIDPQQMEIVLPVYLDQESYEQSSSDDIFHFKSVNIYRSFLAKLEALLHDTPDIGHREKPTLEYDQVTHTFGTTSPSNARYFRERAWLTVKLASSLFDRSPQTIMDWESGTPYPDTVLREYERIYLSAMNGHDAPFLNQDPGLQEAYNDLKQFLQKMNNQKSRFFLHDDGTS